MSSYDFTNFDRQGNIESDIQLTSIDEIRNTIYNETESSIKDINIYTFDLDYEIYNNNEYRELILSFIRDNRHSKLKILVEDLSKAVHTGHILLSMAQQLTSSITIKSVPEDHRGNAFSFIAFDHKSFVFKADKNDTTTIFSKCKVRCNKLSDFFTSVWEQAEQDIHSRRLSI